MVLKRFQIAPKCSKMIQKQFQMAQNARQMGQNAAKRVHMLDEASTTSKCFQNDAKCSKNTTNCRRNVPNARKRTENDLPPLWEGRPARAGKQMFTLHFRVGGAGKVHCGWKRKLEWFPPGKSWLKPFLPSQWVAQMHTITGVLFGSKFVVESQKRPLKSVIDKKCRRATALLGTRAFHWIPRKNLLAAAKLATWGVLGVRRD